MENLEQSITYGRKYNGYYKRKTARDLSGYFARMNARPKRVDFEFGEDNGAWSCPSEQIPGRYKIHLGLAFFDKFADGTPIFETESEWNTCVRYVLSHEEGHILYTTERAWEMANNNGVRSVVSYCAEKALGRKVRITDERSTLQALDLMKTQAGVYINMRMVKEMVHFILNAVEDGRMERRMASSRPGFLYDLRMYRGNSWMHNPVGDSFNQSNPVELFLLSCNQILSLATTGLWQKGYMKNISGTYTELVVRPLIPEIKNAVTARSCKKGMTHALNIIDALRPLFYDACTCDQEDLQQMMEMFMDKISQSMPDMGKNGESQTQYSADEKADARSETQAQNDFQFSESGNESNNEKMPFNIFDDSGEDEGDTDSEDSGSASAGGKAPDNDVQAGGSGNSGESKKNPGKKPSFVAGGKSGSAGQNVSGKGNDEELVIKAMDDAIVNAESESSFTEKAVKSTGATKKKEVVDNSTIQSAVGDISDICADFNEYHRRYSLTENLPADIEEECRVTRAKYEHYFVSRRKPVKCGARAGRLDPRSFSRIVMKDMDIFNQPGDDNSFSGCIYVLVDNSGSMAGLKKVSAMEISARLEEIFKGLVPVKIAAFDTSIGVNFEVIKNWNDDLRKNCSWNYLKYGRCGGGTPTKEALAIAQRELAKRSEKHKLIILITDENAWCAHEKLPSVINSVRKCGIQLSATYVEEVIPDEAAEAFKTLFGKADAVVAKPDELCGAILPVVKKFTSK